MSGQPKPMSYVTAAEMAGPLYEAGLLDHDAAVRIVFTAADGGLTRLGAEDSLARWRDLRAAFGDLLMTAELGLAAAEAQISRLTDAPPTPPTELDESGTDPDTAGL